MCECSKGVRTIRRPELAHLWYQWLAGIDLGVPGAVAALTLCCLTAYDSLLLSCLMQHDMNQAVPLKN